MNGRKVPWTHSRAIAFMYQNVPSNRCMPYLKRQASKESRRYLKNELRKELINLEE